MKHTLRNLCIMAVVQDRTVCAATDGDDEVGTYLSIPPKGPITMVSREDGVLGDRFQLTAQDLIDWWHEVKE